MNPGIALKEATRQLALGVSHSISHSLHLSISRTDRKLLVKPPIHALALSVSSSAFAAFSLETGQNDVRSGGGR